MADAPFWEAKRLDEMSHDEWESLCDRCGKCCGLSCDFACRALDQTTGLCTIYATRSTAVPECYPVTPENVGGWLPDSCAYRLVSEGLPLPSTHRLIAGGEETP